MTKSIITSIMFPAWCWCRKPTTRLICGSFSFDLSKDLSYKCRHVLQSNKYKLLFPEVQFAPDQNTKVNYANTEKGMRLATSVGSTPTGRHAHLIIIDDPLDPKMALSELSILDANNWMDMVIPSRVVDIQLTPIIMIMQRLHQNDPTGHRLAQLESDADSTPVRHICMPADLSEGYEVSPKKLKENYVDGLLDPVRLPRKTLQAARSRMGEFAYAGQYGESPVSLAGGLFLIDRLKYETPAEPVAKQVRYWDKAVSTKKLACYTVGAKLGIGQSGRVYVLDVVRGRWDSDAREKVIKNTALMDGKNVIIGVEEEGGSGGRESALNTLKNLHGFAVKLNKEHTDKAARAEPFSSQVNGSNVSIVPGAWNQEYVSEMQYFPYSTYLDQIDASSGAYNLLNKLKKIGGW
jgi:predicted phage terminase large subunit-like protein